MVATPVSDRVAGTDDWLRRALSWNVVSNAMTSSQNSCLRPFHRSYAIEARGQIGRACCKDAALQSRELSTRAELVGLKEGKEGGIARGNVSKAK
jgi:hypothetical protein